MEVLKVSAKSVPNSVAGALAGVIRERGAAEIQAIVQERLINPLKQLPLQEDLSHQVGLTLSAFQPLPTSRLMVKNGPPLSLLLNLDNKSCKKLGVVTTSSFLFCK
ncbi:stage V sporulation protein [Geomicrobium sp. JCM 19038]|nr:stage V sporulation protein [Geomicrobium sp. JCM 19038]